MRFQPNKDLLWLTGLLALGISLQVLSGCSKDPKPIEQSSQQSVTVQGTEDNGTPLQEKVDVKAILQQRQRQVVRFSNIKVKAANISSTVGDFTKSKPSFSGIAKSGDADIVHKMAGEIWLWLIEGKVYLDTGGVSMPMQITNGNNGDLVLRASAGTGVTQWQWEFHAAQGQLTGQLIKSTSTVINHAGRGQAIAGEFMADLQSVPKGQWPPAPLIDIKAELHNKAVIVKWDARSFLNMEPTHYKVYRKFEFEDHAQEVFLGMATSMNFTDDSQDICQRIRPYSVSFVTYRIVPFLMNDTKDEGHARYVTVTLDDHQQ